MHVHLRIAERGDRVDFEPIHVEAVEDGRYRVLFSPGLIYGLAAGDEIKLDNDGGYTVLKRGGNLVVRVLSARGVAEIEPDLTAQVARIGGRLDGQLRNGLAYTIPARIGRELIGKLFANVKRKAPDMLWEYGNVYDDDGKVMEWLASEA